MADIGEYKQVLQLIAKLPNFERQRSNLLDLRVSRDILQTLRPEFERHLENAERIEERTFAYLMEGLIKAFSCLTQYLGAHAKAFPYHKEACVDILKAQLFHVPPKQLYSSLKLVYNHSFLAWWKCDRTTSDCTDTLTVPTSSTIRAERNGCTVCLKALCRCFSYVEKFRKLNKLMNVLDVGERLVGNIVLEILHRSIRENVSRLPQQLDTNDYQGLHVLNTWLENTAFRWLTDVWTPLTPKTSSDAKSSEGMVAEDVLSVDDLLMLHCRSAEDMLKFHRTRCRALLHECYGTYLIDRIFFIIQQHPHSDPMLKDLVMCLGLVQMKATLVAALTKTLKNNLQQPGVPTGDILTGYVQTIRVLQVLDPSQALMRQVARLIQVCAPVAAYARERSDTVRCIISLLIQDDEDLLLAASHDPSALNAVGEGALLNNEDDDDDSVEWQKWIPSPPSDQLRATLTVNRKSKSKLSATILGMLVGIYGSKELFVKEYRQLLAERLISRRSDGDIDLAKERKYLDLLKTRFGDAELQDCEVMLKDVQDSARIREYIDTKLADSPPEDGALPPLDTLVVSSHFWPELRNDHINLPDNINAFMKTYGKLFEDYKANRAIEFRPMLGRVQLELQLNGQTVRYSVSAPLACVLLKFTEQSTWSVDDLSHALSISTRSVRARLCYWQSASVIREEKECAGTFSVVAEFQAPPAPSNDPTAADQSADELAEVSSCSDEDSGADATPLQDLNVYWSYMQGLMRTLRGISADRLFTMLRMACEGPVTQAHVLAFLEEKIAGGLVVFAGGVYKVKQANAQLTT